MVSGWRWKQCNDQVTLLRRCICGKDSGCALRCVCGCFICELSDHRLLDFVFDGNDFAAFCHSLQKITVCRMRCRSHVVFDAWSGDVPDGPAVFRIRIDTAVSSLADLSCEAYTGVCLWMRVYVFSGNSLWRFFFIFTRKNRMVSGACAGNARDRVSRGGIV